MGTTSPMHLLINSLTESACMHNITCTVCGIELTKRMENTLSVSLAVASSLSERIVEAVGAEGGGAPLTSLQIQFIRNMIHETLEDFRDACHRDIVNLQVEMVKQFYIQLNEIHGLIEKYSVNDSLVEEIEKLREENKRLRDNY